MPDRAPHNLNGLGPLAAAQRAHLAPLEQQAQTRAGARAPAVVGSAAYGRAFAAGQALDGTAAVEHARAALGAG